jgi:formiminotetrahydrofolate cyclodeaminase
MLDSMGTDRRYLDLSVDELLIELASPSPAPGSGFAAAVAVAMGAATITMAARLSPDWAEGRGAAAQAETLRKRVMELASRNAEAYAAALAALKGKEEKYRTRDETMGDALKRAADVPLEIGDAATAVAALAAEVADRGNPRFGADCAAAASLAVAAARAAATLVEVNLGTTGEDERVRRAREQVADASASLEHALAAVA